MKHLKPYTLFERVSQETKIFESNKDIKDRISVVDDFLSELSDNGFNVKCDSVQNGTRLIVDITKYEGEGDSITSIDRKNQFRWRDIKDEVLRLIDLCNDNGLIFRHMGYNSGRNVFGDKIKTFETEENLYLVYLGFDINYDNDKEFYLDTDTIDDYLYSLRDSGSSPIKDKVKNVSSVRVETTNLFVSVLGKEHEIMGVCHMYIRGEGYRWEDIKGELIKIQDTLNTMTNNRYVLRVGRVKDIFSNLLVVNEHESNTIENVDSELENGIINNMEIIIRHK